MGLSDKQSGVESSSEAIKVGDVVTLKSGGPPMTVAVEEREGVLHCVWFGDGLDLRDALFATVALRLF